MEKSKVESIATVLGGVAAAIFIAGVVKHFADQASGTADSATTTAAAGLPAAAGQGIITLAPISIPGYTPPTTGSGGGCNSCGNPFTTVSTQAT